MFLVKVNGGLTYNPGAILVPSKSGKPAIGGSKFIGSRKVRELCFHGNRLLTLSTVYVVDVLAFPAISVDISAAITSFTSVFV